MKLKELLPDVLPLVPGCPNLVAIGALHRAGKALCRDAWVWKHSQTPVKADDDNIVRVASLPERTSAIGVAKAHSPSGREMSAVFEPPETVTVSDHGGEMVTLVVALSPSSRDTEWPDWVVDEYGEGIASGALYRLMTMPTVEWSNPEQAGHHYNLYRETSARAKSEALRGHAAGIASINVPRLV